MRRAYLTTLITSLLVIGVFALIYGRRNIQSGIVKVGFIYEGDESTPYTYNFALAEHALHELIGKKGLPDGALVQQGDLLLRVG